MIKVGSRVESKSYGPGTVRAIERDRPGESLAWVRFDCWEGTRHDHDQPAGLSTLREIPVRVPCPCGDSFHGECLGCVPEGC